MAQNMFLESCFHGGANLSFPQIPSALIASFFPSAQERLSNKEVTPTGSCSIKSTHSAAHNDIAGANFTGNQHLYAPLSFCMCPWTSLGYPQLGWTWAKRRAQVLAVPPLPHNIDRSAALQFPGAWILSLLPTTPSCLSILLPQWEAFVSIHKRHLPLFLANETHWKQLPDGNTCRNSRLTSSWHGRYLFLKLICSGQMIKIKKWPDTKPFCLWKGLALQWLSNQPCSHIFNQELGRRSCCPFPFDSSA